MQIILNENGDALIKNNQLHLTLHNSDEEISQRIRQAILFYYGEWFLNTTLGIPWFQVILEKGTPIEVIEGILKDAIISVDGVSNLKRFDPIEYEPATRQMRVYFQVVTTNGELLTINEVLP